MTTTMPFYYNKHEYVLRANTEQLRIAVLTIPGHEPAVHRVRKDGTLRCNNRSVPDPQFLLPPESGETLLALAFEAEATYIAETTEPRRIWFCDNCVTRKLPA